MQPLQIVHSTAFRKLYVVFVQILLFNKCSSLYMVEASDGSSTLRSILLA